MTKDQLSQALTLARNLETPLPGYLSEEMAIFEGCADREFKPIYVTVDQLASLIRGQVVSCFDGSLDSEELQEIANYGRLKFMVI